MIYQPDENRYHTMEYRGGGGRAPPQTAPNGGGGGNKGACTHGEK
ncbi:L-glyceraldehyde 3-phosphate reductase, partial [Salmonella enterica]